MVGYKIRQKTFNETFNETFNDFFNNRVVSVYASG